MNLDELHLRALEPEDLAVLEQVENDTVYWNHSNQTEPFSLYTSSNISSSKVKIFLKCDKRL